MCGKAKAGLSSWKVAGREIGRKFGMMMMSGCQKLHCFLFSPLAWRAGVSKLDDRNESVHEQTALWALVGRGGRSTEWFLLIPVRGASLMMDLHFDNNTLK